jgi:ribosomal-protein-alanine N-acetyltransferase
MLTPDEMAAIHRACFSTPRPWSASEIAGLLESPHCFTCVAKDGFLLGRAVAGEAELLTLAVNPPSQGRGIGAQLIDMFLDAARGRHCAQAFLEVAENNPAAIHLYLKKGFQQLGKRPAYYHFPDGSTAAALNFSFSLSSNMTIF